MKQKCKCNTQIESKFSDKEKLYYFFCPQCQLGGKGKTEKEAAEKFQQSIMQQHEINGSNLPALKSKDEFPTWIQNNEHGLMIHAPQFIDKPETSLMIQKNIRYLLKADLKKVWDTAEGRESIVDAFIDALRYCSTLGETGNIVPFGAVAEFIPEITCFKMALTAGKNPPFSEIHIDPIYGNDQYDMSRNDGEFKFEIKKMGFPRGDIIGVVVQVKDIKTGKMIGEAYDEKRLMEKAELFSASYKYYLQDMRALKKAQAEGKDHIIKWEKKFYEHDITNPYANANKPEMLKKLAGKSFLWPLVKERNVKAAAGEQTEADKPDTPITILNDSIGKVKQDIIDADFKIDEEPVTEQPSAGEKKTSKPEKEKADLFDGDTL